jgi:hypothetical protein
LAPEWHQEGVSSVVVFLRLVLLLLVSLGVEASLLSLM